MHLRRPLSGVRSKPQPRPSTMPCGKILQGAYALIRSDQSSIVRCISRQATDFENWYHWRKIRMTAEYMLEEARQTDEMFTGSWDFRDIELIEHDWKQRIARQIWIGPASRILDQTVMTTKPRYSSKSQLTWPEEGAVISGPLHFEGWSRGTARVRAQSIQQGGMPNCCDDNFATRRSHEGFPVTSELWGWKSIKREWKKNKQLPSLRELAVVRPVDH